MELHSEEYAAMSPTTLESQGLLIQQHVTNPTSDTSKKLTGKLIPKQLLLIFLTQK